MNFFLQHKGANYEEDVRDIGGFEALEAVSLKVGFGALPRMSNNNSPRCHCPAEHVFTKTNRSFTEKKCPSVGMRTVFVPKNGPRTT